MTGVTVALAVIGFVIAVPFGVLVFFVSAWGMSAMDTRKQRLDLWREARKAMDAQGIKRPNGPFRKK